MEAATFLRLVFPEISAAQRISIFALPSKKVGFFAEVAAAAAAATALDADGTSGVYCGVAYYQAGVTTGRGKASDVVAIPGLWADVDFGTHHKKSRIAPDQAAAEAIVRRIGLAPSLIVHSGHGLQPWWLFDECVTVADGASLLAKRWGQWVQRCALALDLMVDSVWDLARVLRVPGTTNRKDPSAPLPVTLNDDDGSSSGFIKRYSSLDIEAHISDLPADEPTAALAVVGELILDPEREPLASKLLVLIENDPKFKKTWERKRKDLTDDSASGYEAALGKAFVQAGWKDQEILDGWYSWRRKHGESVEKLMRRDYVVRTIALVRQGSQAPTPINEIIPEPNIPVTEKRDMLLPSIEKEMGLPCPIKKIIKAGAKPFWTIELVDGRKLEYAGTSMLRDFYNHQSEMGTKLSIIPRHMKQDAWDRVVEKMSAAAESHELAEDTPQDLLNSWIESMIEDTTVSTGDAVDAAFVSYAPFEEGGVLHIATKSLKTVIKTKWMDPINQADLCRYLKIAGWQPKNVYRTINGKQYCRRTWVKGMNSDPKPEAEEHQNRTPIREPMRGF